MGGGPGQVTVSVESQADVIVHVFWKRVTTAIFGVRIINLDAGSYLNMTPQKEFFKSQIRRRRTINFRFAWSVGAPSLPWFNLKK